MAKSALREVVSRLVGVNFLWPWSKNRLCHGQTLVGAMQQIADWLKKRVMSEYA